MFTTNNGGAPGVNAPIKKAAGASNTNGLHTDTNSANFRTDGAIQQAHDSKTFFARLKTVYSHIKDAVSGFYIQRSIGLDSIAMLILVAVFAVVRAFQ